MVFDRKAYMKKYRQENKERLSEYHKKYRQENKEILVKKSMEYNKNHPENTKKAQQKYNKQRYNSDPEFRKKVLEYNKRYNKDRYIYFYNIESIRKEKTELKDDWLYD